ncbi:alkaline phosphatase family protein [Longimicrobium sp.]|uniref:alkaline phosphatase family protein n=1 Tax=Longimicrobium sp. TaxID=2029185 RepID=UPI002E3602D9|nr:alkaline phosphatase family protein [Longimicrobium sp.]HEX6038715.1 alkaline phosphatase family protein [Longimicrobium sp.]
MIPRPRRALLVFLDGVGIGSGDASFNPFAVAHLPRLEALLGGRRPVAEHLDADGRIRTERAVLVASDATLGMEGLPQSGTGQTSLLTGRNAAKEYGRHFGPWVPTPVRPMLAAENLLSRAKAAGLTAVFANAYPLAGADPRIFRRPAAPMLAAQAAGALTRGAAELAERQAVASSITNERWRERLGDDMPQVTPEEAARTLARITAGADVTLFAHYDTDYTGHRGEMAGAVAALEKVDAFLGALVDALPADALLVVSSDHGNLEDTRGGHTRNPVPVLAAGPGHSPFGAARSIMDVAVGISYMVGFDPDLEEPDADRSDIEGEEG